MPSASAPRARGFVSRISSPARNATSGESTRGRGCDERGGQGEGGSGARRGAAAPGANLAAARQVHAFPLPRSDGRRRGRSPRRPSNRPVGRGNFALPRGSLSVRCALHIYFVNRERFTERKEKYGPRPRVPRVLPRLRLARRPRRWYPRGARRPARSLAHRGNATRRRAPCPAALLFASAPNFCQGEFHSLCGRTQSAGR